MILRELRVEAQVTGPLVMDALLAALALEYGVSLVTTDRDFARFPKLKVTNRAAGGSGLPPVRRTGLDYWKR